MRGIHPDGLEQLVLVVPLEGRLADQHLVHQHAKGPPVYREGVLLPQQDLREEEGGGGETSVVMRESPSVMIMRGHKFTRVDIKYGGLLVRV